LFACVSFAELDFVNDNYPLVELRDVLVPVLEVTATKAASLVVESTVTYQLIAATEAYNSRMKRHRNISTVVLLIIHSKRNSPSGYRT